MTEQYVLFAGDQYYPVGGMWDYQGCFESIDSAKAHFEKLVEERDLFSPWANIARITEQGLVRVASKTSKGSWMEAVAKE